jgi:hypothetical protein
MGTVRLYERFNVTDWDNEFQILIHARTRFAHPTVGSCFRKCLSKLRPRRVSSNSRKTF